MPSTSAPWSVHRGPSAAKALDRLLELGATLIDDRRNPGGSGWAVLTDPEGNEFCVERSQAEFDRDKK